MDIAVLRGGEEVRVRRAAPTRDAALKLERELRAKMDRGEIADAKAVLYREWSKEFFEVYVTNNNKPSERMAKEQVLRDHLLPFFGETRIDRICVAQIERFKSEQLKVGAKPKSINNRLAVLRRSLVIANEWGHLALVPKVQRLKTAKEKFRFLSFEEATSLLDGAAPEWRAMILLALRTGLRHGELLALKWENVDLVGGRVFVRRNVYRGIEGTPKGGHEREVPLSGEALAALRALPSRFRDNYVFGSGAVRLTAGETKWPLWSACRRGGIDRCGWHVLRHTFASHLVMRGVVLKAVQELMGHATIDMTMRYAHLSPVVRSDAVQLLDGRSGSGPFTARSGTGS